MRVPVRGLVLLAIFIGLPILEIYVIIQVGQQIGAMPTVLLLIAESALGGWLVKREGKRAWVALRSALTSGTLPGRELADAAIVLVGGVLLLTPGFVTDVFGFFCVLPFTRPLARRLLATVVSQRIVRHGLGGYPSRTRGGVHQIYRDPPPDP
jgi:UPF0716 protein FxsA